MKLNITHTTDYDYSAPLQNSVQSLHLIPRSSEHQRILKWVCSWHTPSEALGVSEGETLEQRDGFGNSWSMYAPVFPAQQMKIQVSGIIEIDPSTVSLHNDDCPPEVFLAPTALTTLSPELSAFKEQYLTSTSREDLIAFAGVLYDRVVYTPTSTVVNTTASEAFALGRGVCQDHTHIFLACARAMGLPARYVSGYFFVDLSHLEWISSDHKAVPFVSQLATHAWAEVFLNGAWYCFDVSNQLFTPSQHVYLAVGRDYLDVAPIKGVRQGGGLETMQTAVHIQSIA